MKLFGKKALIDNISRINKVELEKRDSSIIAILKQNNIQFEIKGSKAFNSLDKNLNHQGIISYVEDKASSLEDIYTRDNAIVLIVDSLQDPQNFGAILRSCDAFGVDAVIYKKDNQVQINDFVIKTSMGAINNLNLFRVTNLANEIESLKKNGFWVYASALNQKSENYKKVKYEKKTVLIVGNESDGVSKLLLEKSDFIIEIPMCGNVQSLNVSVATGILLSEIKNK